MFVHVLLLPISFRYEYFLFGVDLVLIPYFLESVSCIGWACQASWLHRMDEEEEEEEEEEIVCLRSRSSSKVASNMPSSFSFTFIFMLREDEDARDCETCNTCVWNYTHVLPSFLYALVVLFAFHFQTMYCMENGNSYGLRGICYKNVHFSKGKWIKRERGDCYKSYRKGTGMSCTSCSCCPNGIEEDSCPWIGSKTSSVSKIHGITVCQTLRKNTA